MMAAAIGLAAGATASRAAPPAAITVDVASGRVLEAANIDAPRWPASVAKLMTIYLALNALKAEKITDEARVVISPNAAAQPPTKLGLQAGDRARFGDLVAAAAVASANDAAMAVGETLAGSETLFVELMNAEARRLGLSNTRFANPSGLPQPGQQTTARDLALLARAILTEHADRLGLFGRIRGVAAGRPFRTTNGLLSRYDGAFGLKTGFTCRAGYNLVAAAQRDGRRVIAVTLGHQNPAERNAAAIALLDRGFARAAAGGGPHRTLEPAPAGGPSGEPPEIGACAPATVDGREGLSGWGVFLGARPSRAEAEAEIMRAAGIANTRGKRYVAKRDSDDRWVSVLSGYDRPEAVRACAAIRRAGGYCLTMAPEVLKNERALWR